MRKNILYGIDSGSIKNPEEIKKLSEDLLFFTIENLTTSIFCTWNATKNDDNPLDLTEDYIALEFCIYQTRKFGVDIPEAVTNKHVELTESYRLWIDFWREHFDSLSYEEFMHYDSAVKCGKDASKYLPKETFKQTKDKKKIFVRK